ncbi:hypothetical protein [Sorangium cellulosum]|nr:hypothetical protein [Sorangium cellulosum]
MRAMCPHGLDDARPWHCSPRVLRLIVALALSCEETGSVAGGEGGNEEEERSGEALRVLIDRVTTNARAARRLAGVLDAALLNEACGYYGLCVSELASRWASVRAAAPAREAAALLWASARAPGSPMRLLEERIADDLEVRALRTMATTARTADALRWPSPPRLTRRAGQGRGERRLSAGSLAGRGR